MSYEKTLRYNKEDARRRILIKRRIEPSVSTSTSLCIYCGQPRGRVRKGEHIIPDTIGGVRTIKEVCAACNNGVLSDIDRELCSVSPLAIVAAEVYGNGIGQTWDVDHRAGNVLLEGAPSWAEQSMTVWPQIIVTNKGPEIRGDYEEVLEFGPTYFRQIFVRHMRQAYWRWRSTGKGLIFRPLRSANDLLEVYRYPPRIFVERRMRDFNDKITFLIGYRDSSGKRQALHTIDNWDSGGEFKRFDVQLGSHLPAVRRYWDVVKIIRALTKLGINLLRDTCQRTTVDHRSFSQAIGFVMGRSEPSINLFHQCGFIWPSDVAELHRDDGGHSFRLLHDSQRWRLYCSFFGGRVCATVRFPGPCNENWSTADISTPLASHERDVSPEWQVSRHRMLLPYPCHIEWTAPERVIPSVELLNTKHRIDTSVIEKPITLKTS